MQAYGDNKETIAMYKNCTTQNINRYFMKIVIKNWDLEQYLQIFLYFYCNIVKLKT